MEEKIVEDIIKKYDLYRGQVIDYKTFLLMYKEFGKDKKEAEFAQLLGIKYKTFLAFKSKASKNENANVIILMDRSLTNQEKGILLLQLVDEYDFYKLKKIDYQLFKEIYEKYKTKLTEIEFIELLGSTESTLKAARKNQSKIELFSKFKLPDDRVHIIKRNIMKQYEGKKIYYKENGNGKGDVDFLEIYRQYRIYFSENEFVKLIGISEKNLYYAKKKLGNPKIKDIEKIKKINEMKKEIGNLAFCTKIEIEQLCKKYDISVDDFITYYINKANFFDPEVYKSALEINGGLYVRQIKVSQGDIVRYNKLFDHIVATIVGSEINTKYGENYLDEDLMSEMKIFIICSCGDIIKNFQFDEKLMERMIWLRARNYARIKFISEYKKDIKNIELDGNKFENKQKKDNEDYQLNDEMEEYKKLDEIILIELFKKYLSEGYSKEDIIAKVSSRYDIGKEEMLEMMKKYLLEKGKVVQNSKGEFQIGED